MLRLFAILVAGFFAVGILSSCNVVWNKMLDSALDPSDLYPRFETKTMDLTKWSKCPNRPSINLINATKRTEQYLIETRVAGMFRHYVKPKRLTTQIIDYLKIAYNRHGISPNSNSGKKIYISFVSLQTSAHFITSVGKAKLSIKIDIPEVKYTKIITTKDQTFGGGLESVAYTIHRATFRIIRDPVVQDYILCRKTPGAK